MHDALGLARPVVSFLTPPWAVGTVHCIAHRMPHPPQPPLAALVPGILLAVGATPAHAQSEGSAMPSAVRVDVSGCDEIRTQAQAIRGPLRLELRPMGVEVLDAEEAGEGTALVHVHATACDPKGQVRLLLLDLDTGRLRRRKTELALDTPDAPRAVALIATELLRTGWPTLQQEASEVNRDEAELRRKHRALQERIDQLERRSAEARARSETVRQRRERELAQLRRASHRNGERLAELAATRKPTPGPPPFLVVVAATATSYPAGDAALGGARAGIDAPLGPVRLVVEAGGGIGRARTEVGDVRLWAVRATGVLLTPATDGPVSVAAGLFGQVGYSTAEGQPNEELDEVSGRRVDSGLAAVGGRLALDIRLKGAWWLDAAIDVGYAPWWG